MDFTQKVYYNDKPIVLCSNARYYADENSETTSYLQLYSLDDANLKQALTHLDEVSGQGVIIEVGDKDAALSRMMEAFPEVRAGGGLVYNPTGDLLMIFRRGKWDLPKGKQDEGETIEACTLREITEETGLSQIELGEWVCDTWHIYQEKGINKLKHTTWFVVHNTANENFVVQAEEDITEAQWVNPANIAPFAGNTYRAIKELLLTAGLSW